MDQLEELERRISVALDRISASSTMLGANDGSMAEALEAERNANAQLEERVKAIKERQETMVASLEAEVTDLKAALSARDSEMQRVRAVNAQLRKHTEALREANKSGLSDAHLINKAMMAEMDALRASADSTRAELDEILGTIEPMLEEGANA